MKRHPFTYFGLLALTLLLLYFTVDHRVAANYCPCDLNNNEMICGSNGVTYKNRCEFDCTQRDYKKLGRILNIAKMGHC